jgi:hypothetical protein
MLLNRRSRISKSDLQVATHNTKKETQLLQVWNQKLYSKILLYINKHYMRSFRSLDATKGEMHINFGSRGGRGGRTRRGANR